MKLISGSEITGYVKERHAKQVRSLKQSRDINPKIVIVATSDGSNDALKSYASDIGVEVNKKRVDQADVLATLEQLNDDDSVHGIVVQSDLTEQINSIHPHKDIAGLGEQAQTTSPIAMAVSWLIDGYNINLSGKQIAIVGQGSSVGVSTQKLLESQGFTPQMLDSSASDLRDKLLQADVVISANGRSGFITTDMIKHGAVVIDAAEDAAPELYDRDDLTITSQQDGVKPLAICTLFENLIRSLS